MSHLHEITSTHTSELVLRLNLEQRCTDILQAVVHRLCLLNGVEEEAAIGTTEAGVDVPGCGIVEAKSDGSTGKRCALAV